MQPYTPTYEDREVVSNHTWSKQPSHQIRPIKRTITKQKGEENITNILKSWRKEDVGRHLESESQ